MLQIQRLVTDRTRRTRIILGWLAPLCWAMLPWGEAGAHGASPPSLKGVQVPTTPGLLDGTNPIVVDSAAAVVLGKALFWDIDVGSDGMACASCHFHAGADRRTTNQLAPGTFHTSAATGQSFEKTASGAKGGPGYSLRLDDFPLHRIANPDDKTSAVLYDTDDVVASAGVFHADFQAAAGDGSRDTCLSSADPLFHRRDLNTRRVEPRNTPTVINAAFNFRNFWDGRANNIFNGETPFGARDGAAGVWVAQKPGGKAQKQQVRLENAALASQAMAPPVNDIEMSCAGRTFPELGRKLLQRRPLATQAVHKQDSVLGPSRHASGQGLDTTYAALVQKAFAPRYWSGTGKFGAPPQGGAYTQMEANFSFFFGLALQLYQETLISDDSPFDTPRDANDMPLGLNEQQARGLALFVDAHCPICHRGPTLSSAAHPYVYSYPAATGPQLVNRKTLRGSFTGQGVAFALMDEGFANTSVTPDAYDPGLGGTDPFGNPLSFTAQYLELLTGSRTALTDPIAIKACSFDVPFTSDYVAAERVDDPLGSEGCGARLPYAKVPASAVLAAELTKPGQGRALASVQGAFKIPSLRNVELTGPYMHNGGMKTLEEVVDFYSRGGNFDNPEHFATVVFPQGFSALQKADLVAFLKSLTDERVRWERAPFDHPALPIPQGPTNQPSAQDPQQAGDKMLNIPAVGKLGRPASRGPLQPFESFLRP